MIIVGVDAHKRTHTCVAVDSRGQRLGEKTVPATGVGNASALKWALLKFGPELTWAIEDVRTVSGRLEHELMSSGQRVVRVTAIRWIALVSWRLPDRQIRLDGPGRQHYDKRRKAGDSSPAALRNLKRRITRDVFSRLHADEADRRSLATADTPSHE
jgi:hypothetical protein